MMSDVDGHSWSPDSGVTLDAEDADFEKDDANNLSTAPGEGNLSPEPLVKEETMKTSTMFGRDSATLGTQAPTTEGAYLSGAATQRMESLLSGEAADACCQPTSGAAVGSLAGLTFAEASEVFATWWMSELCFVETHCRTQPRGRGILPLPTSTSGALTGLLGDLGKESACFFNLCRSLNSLGGVSAREVTYEGNVVQDGALKYLHDQSLRMATWSEKFDALSWQDFFRVKGVDYRGEEILTAKFTSWSNVEPALPSEVGRVGLSKITELGVQHFVTDFETYLLPEEDMILATAPKVMVLPECWEALAGGLIRKGICGAIHESEVFSVGGSLVLNGLFGVSKNEWTPGPAGVEVHRLIMNLIPINQLCRSIDGDVATLPGLSSLAPLCLLEDEELVVSSEDVRCFFYIFKTPSVWHRFMAFNRVLPQSLCPPLGAPGKYYLCSHVLPMGFKNSVSIAQHIHRVVVRLAGARCPSLSLAASEVRKDRPFSSTNPLIRIYLDNFDQLERVNKKVSCMISGTPSAETLALRAEYERWGIPNHPKKSVMQQSKAEVQGAIIDGTLGIAYPRPEKLLKYVQLLLLKKGSATLKQVQVVGGGLVYLAMFRRPLLGGLNAIWQFVLELDRFPPVTHLPLPFEVKLELMRFVGLAPLAVMDFRLSLDSMVSASDASTTGGGITASRHLTGLGEAAALSHVRGDIAGDELHSQVLSIGLFDGIGALRVALDCLGVSCIGHVSVESSLVASRVVEAHFPGTLFFPDVTLVTDELVLQWACKFSQACLVILGAGPPCQGVSGLNCDRKGALRDHRSSLFKEVRRIEVLVRKRFPWAMVHVLMESVSSMDDWDREEMSRDLERQPLSLDASGVSLARRPRLYWITCELQKQEGVTIYPPSSSDWKAFGTVELEAIVDESLYLEPGWTKVSSEPFPTFTTSRPRDHAGRRPAGVHQCTPEELKTWTEDSFRFPPYQYREKFRVKNKEGSTRIVNIGEREAIMGFPLGYTAACRGKTAAKQAGYNDDRLSLIGNSWNVTVVSWLLSQLLYPLGLCRSCSVQDCVTATSPGSSSSLQGLLVRPPLPGGKRPSFLKDSKLPSLLARKLCGLVSIKGEDILLSAPSDLQVRYHRLRASVPSNLWKWRTISGWVWKGSPEHINVLEMRAVLTTLRWRLEKRKQVKQKFVHLIDSQVVLHSLSRGRSSSRKLRRTLLRINSLLLASGCYGVWAYVHTSLNPADRPSRRPVRKKWVK